MKRVMFAGMVLLFFVVTPVFAQNAASEIYTLETVDMGDNGLVIVENLLAQPVTVQVANLAAGKNEVFVVEPGVVLTHKFLKGSTVDIFEGTGDNMADSLVSYVVGDQNCISRTTKLSRNSEDQLVDVDELLTSN
jgi:hypothetical protein